MLSHEYHAGLSGTCWCGLCEQCEEQLGLPAEVCSRSIAAYAPSQCGVDLFYGLFDPQDLVQGGAADLELALVGLARADRRAGSRGPGRRSALASGVSALRSDHAKTSTAAAIDASATAPPAAGPGFSSARRSSNVPGEVRGEHRRDEVRAAAVVLLGGLARRRRRLLVGRDRLVLDAVVGGELAVAQRQQRGRQRDSRPPPRRRAPRGAPGAAAGTEAPAIAPSTRASWKGSLAAGSARLTSGITTIASPSRTTPRTPGTPSKARSRGLRPEATSSSPALVAHGGGPVRRARARAGRCAAPSRRGGASPRSVASPHSSSASSR